MKDAIVVGHGGLAKEIIQYIYDTNQSNNEWNILGFSTNDPNMLGTCVGDSQIRFHDSDLWDYHDNVYLFLGIGFPLIAASVISRLKQNVNLLYPNMIHPKSYLSSKVELGEGNIVTPGVVISTDVVIGSFNLFNWNVTIGHDTSIGDFNVINPGANVSGSVRVGSRVLIGTGTQLLQGLNICDDVIIGAGAVVTKDITESGTYVGIPAKRIK